MGRHSRRGSAPQEVRDPAAGDTSEPANRPVPVHGPADRPVPPVGGRLRPSGVARPSEDRSTPAHGTAVDGAPGRQSARGGHPQEEPSAPPVAGGMVATARGPQSGPRQEYLDAFDDPSDDVFAAGAPEPRRPDPVTAPAAATAFATGSATAGPPVSAGPVPAGTADTPETAGKPKAPEDAAPATRRRSRRGRAFTGSMAAAVTTVLAVVIAGQVAGGTSGARKSGGTAAASTKRPHGGTRAVPPTHSAAPAQSSYAEAMSRVYPLDVDLHGPGTFHTIDGHAEGPGGRTELTYRVDVEDGLPLDGELFAEAVQRTVNDPRSWAHDHAYSFSRVSTGKPDFVVTLASPGTTGVWCAKSGLDTTVEHVSCDSAATPRVMINGWRWAQGSSTYGDAHIFSYRQMLLNHEVGHRLGHDHETCPADGALAPVMMQQTKTLTLDGHTCRRNPWVYPPS
jgi:uncharacterized protein DUF3152